MPCSDGRATHHVRRAGAIHGLRKGGMRGLARAAGAGLLLAALHRRIVLRQGGRDQGDRRRQQGGTDDRAADRGPHPRPAKGVDCARAPDMMGSATV